MSSFPGTPICDFCSSPDVRWRYHSSDFEMGLMLLGDWAACDVCHNYIQNNDWIGLRKYVVNAYVLLHERLNKAAPPSKALDQVLDALYVTFRKQTYGCTPYPP